MTADPDAAVWTLADEIVDDHNAHHHPGHTCAENEHGQCLDAFGGSPVRGTLGRREPLEEVR